MGRWRATLGDVSQEFDGEDESEVIRQFRLECPGSDKLVPVVVRLDEPSSLAAVRSDVERLNQKLATLEETASTDLSNQTLAESKRDSFDAPQGDEVLSAKDQSKAEAKQSAKPEAKHAGHDSKKS